MPWKETDPMNERVQFIAAYLSAVYSMTELCERFDIRRNTGYKWVRRNTADGTWSIYFYDVLLARLDERDFRLYT